MGEVTAAGSCLCGSALFGKKNGENRISFSSGGLAQHPGLRLSKNIFTEDKDDYYSISEQE